MAGEERGAPAPYAYVSRLVVVRHARVAGDEPRETRGILEDATQLGVEVLSEGTRHFVPWAGVGRLTLIEEAAEEPGGGG